MKKMPSILKVLLLFAATVPVLTGCDSKEEQYQRPEWLEPPIYQQLQAKGNFTHYLACVDKAGYKKQLNGSGFYTVFAPTDSAFSVFLTENGFGSVEAIDSTFARKIVSYSMAMTPASYEQIDDFLDGSTSATDETRTNKAFKRTTYNYKWVYEETDVTKNERKHVIDINSSSGIPGISFPEFSIDDFNQKNIPFFTTAFMTQRGISVADYNYFYPNAVLTDFNVVDAKVIERDIWAENGIIHIVNKVIPPLPNLEEILAETDECSEFKSILDKYMVEYELASDEFQLKYEQVAGKRQDIYLKTYEGACFNLNCENYLTFLRTSLKMDAQTDGYTLFAPSNSAMEEFYKGKFFKYGYKSLDEMPNYIIHELVNSHMFMTTVWPTKFASTMNQFGEPARFDAHSDVIKRVFGSNGVFYAVNKVQATNSFSTVLGDVLLNPNYSLMYQALLNVEPLAENLKSKRANYLLFLITNEQFKEAGLAYNPNSSAWEFTSASDRPDLGTVPSAALARLINLHIVLLPGDKTYDLMNGTGVIKSYGEEYIRYNKGTIYASGNPAAKRPRINSPINSGAENGQSYTLSSPMLFSNGNIGDVLSVSSTNKAYKATQLLAYLIKIATATYLNEGVPTYVASCVYNASTGVVKDIANTSYITVFLPNDVAIAQAVTDGVLKPISNFANGALGPDELTLDNLAMENFLKNHIIKGNVVVGDVLSTDLSTFRKQADGTFSKLRIEGDNAGIGSLKVVDSKGRTANVVTSAPAAYNILGNRAIVHVIDNYLAY